MSSIKYISTMDNRLQDEVKRIASLYRDWMIEWQDKNSDWWNKVEGNLDEMFGKNITRSLVDSNKLLRGKYLGDTDKRFKEDLKNFSDILTASMQTGLRLSSLYDENGKEEDRKLISELNMRIRQTAKEIEDIFLENLNYREVWGSCLKIIKDNVNSHSYITLFEKIRPIQLSR